MAQGSCSTFFVSLGAFWLCLSFPLTGTGCGKSKDQTKEEPEKAIGVAPLKAPVAKTPPDRIRLTFEEDPGFWVPLTALDKFESLNQMLPAEMRSVATWASLRLTMADGSIEVVNAPQDMFGEAGYHLRGAAPGINLVAFDKQSNAVRATWGPLASVHVAATEAANSNPKPFPIVVDGKEQMVDPRRLAAISTSIEPDKNKTAWKLASVVNNLVPGCTVSSLTVFSGDTSSTVNPDHFSNAYLRANRRGSWMFSVVGDDGVPIRERVRDVTRMDVACKRNKKR